MSNPYRSQRNEDDGEMEISEGATDCLTAESSVKAKSQERTPREMLKSFQWDGLSMYDHVKHIMELVLATRPGNVIDHFDQFSRSIRDPKGKVRPSDRFPMAQKTIKLAGQLINFDMKLREDEEEEGTAESPMGRKISSCIDMADFFEQMNVGLTKYEYFRIDAALRLLGSYAEHKEVRFWGKIFGVDRSYIVAECTLTQEEISRRQNLESQVYQEEGEGETEGGEAAEKAQVFGFGAKNAYVEEEEDYGPLYKKLGRYVMPPLPQPAKQKPKKMKPEMTGEGANRRVYYVCHEACDSWIPLPNVKPEAIVAARKLKRHLLGYLSAPVQSFPPFPGTEKDLLRAQIARITAGTHISPIGYFHFGSSEEMAEEGDMDELVVNIDFKEVPYQDLLDPGFWVHHSPHILRIGRCTFPEEHTEMGEEMGEEEEEKRKQEELLKKEKQELGPPLLTPLSEDMSMEEVPPWLTHATSKMIPGSGVVAIKSNLWPGAFAFCKNSQWENIYLGDGVKLHNLGYSPARPTRAELEDASEIREETDPSPEMEAEWRLMHRPPSLPHFEEGGFEENIFDDISED